MHPIEDGRKGQPEVVMFTASNNAIASAAGTP
jgi:hypothetical protein